ncbi:hypothetical protein [Abyssalbus ytuae]|uniref:CHAT domain-containing protein n=1 Tax=Abyssalbus ytuae TaxID=2926907 RepID=A0A9E6ZX29_9FLAO|nr:hypothetical protein [Abyssalbus ytuae]UOB18406.1 hypothetical protein MQE35_03740 [Abyssalbus ytuae]
MQKILFIKVNPVDTANLRLEKEENSIRNALEKSVKRAEFELVSRGAVTTEDLLQYLVTIKPNILHISGHGDEQNNLFFEDHEGFKEEIPISKFSLLLDNFMDHIHCVFFNACHSLSKIDNLSNQLPYIIGMRKEIADDIAINFSQAFYTAYFNGKNIHESFTIALNIISLKNFNDELIPRLLENTNHGETELTRKQNFLEQKLVSDEEVEMAKNQKKRKMKFYYRLAAGTFILAAIFATALFFLNQNMLVTLLGGVFPGILGSLPFVEIKKGKNSLDLINLFDLKRKRLMKAISYLTKEEVDKLNEEFYNILTMTS